MTTISPERIDAILSRQQDLQGQMPRIRHAELVSASIARPAPLSRMGTWTLKQVQGDDHAFRRRSK
jgi:hypothetical protein